MPQWETRKRRWKRKPYRARYAQAHRAKRKALAPAVAVGLYKCARCGEPIQPGEPWDSAMRTAMVFATRARAPASVTARGREPRDSPSPQGARVAARAGAAKVARVVISAKRHVRAPEIPGADIAVTGQARKSLV